MNLYARATHQVRRRFGNTLYAGFLQLNSWTFRYCGMDETLRGETVPSWRNHSKLRDWLVEIEPYRNSIRRRLLNFKLCIPGMAAGR